MGRLARHWLLLLPALAVACSRGAEAPQKREEPPPRPTVNHELHLSRDLECGDCHDPDETGTPVMPVAETCFECHEDLTQENERVQAYFKTARQADGGTRFERPRYWPDLTPNHEGHTGAEVACAECHGTPQETAFARPAPLAFMAQCMDCHTARGQATECATCHQETRKDKKPFNHDPAFLKAHGGQIPGGWNGAPASACALCHDVPRGCKECHTKTKPESHGRDAFRRTHGTDTDAWTEPWGEASCALCHERKSCVLCHQVKKPRSHTRPFERRLHGIAATIERENCTVCHKQDFCVNCHQVQQPVTHRGQWGSGQQSHCLACHQPLTTTGCYACHKNTLGHLQSPPPPADAVHTAAADPSGCQACHLTLPHFDVGDQCRSCHR